MISKWKLMELCLDELVIESKQLRKKIEQLDEEVYQHWCEVEENYKEVRRVSDVEKR